MVTRVCSAGRSDHGTGLSVPGTARHRPSRSPVWIWIPVSSTSRPQTSRPNIESGIATPSSITLSSEEPGSHLPRRMPLVSGSRTSTTSTLRDARGRGGHARDIAGDKGRAGRLEAHDAPRLDASQLDASLIEDNCDHKNRRSQSTRISRCPPEGLPCRLAPIRTPHDAAAAAHRDRAAKAPVHDQVYAAIRNGLVDGSFVPGRSVTLRGLAAMLGVSPMPVRAAVTRLVAEGALALTPTRRVCVPAMTPGPLRRIRPRPRSCSRARRPSAPARHRRRHAGPHRRS